MQNQNHRTTYNTLRQKIRCILFFASLIAVEQPCIGQTKQDQNVSEVDIKIGKEVFSPWYQEDFYKQHRKDPEYEFGSPDKAQKAFIKNKYVVLRNKIVEELLVVGSEILIMVFIAAIVEFYTDSIINFCTAKLQSFGLDSAELFNIFFGEPDGPGNRVLRLDNSVVLLVLKYLYKNVATRGFITPYKAINDWQRADAIVVLTYFFKNYLTQILLVIPQYSKLTKDRLLSSVVGISLFSPVLAVLGVVLLDIYRMWNSHIIPMINFWISGESVETLDDMQEAELLYIRNEHRMSEKMQTLIEKLLLEARKYPEKRPMLSQMINHIVSLPTQEEATAPNEIQDVIDLSSMYAYEKQVIDYAERLCYRSTEGISKMHHPYLVGPSGVGKTHFLKLFADAIGAKIARVSFAGVSVKELIGYSAEDGKKGYIGRIAETLQKASEYGKYPVILFIDEIDKALDGPYKKEINALCLELFESNTQSFNNPFLDNLPIYFPNIIIFAGNKDLTGPLKDRVETIPFYGYDWAAKRLLIYGTKNYKGKLDSLCEELGLNRNDLNKEDYKAIEKILNETEKEEEKLPENQKDKGVRQLEIRIIRYLFLNKLVKADHKRLKAQMRRHVKNQPPVEAF